MPTALNDAPTGSPMSVRKRTISDTINCRSHRAFSRSHSSSVVTPGNPRTFGAFVRQIAVPRRVVVHIAKKGINRSTRHYNLAADLDDPPK
jgi:hypothetical protein